MGVHFVGHAGKYKEALIAFKVALQLESSHSVATLGLARLHRTMGHDKEAEDLFLK